MKFYVFNVSSDKNSVNYSLSLGLLNFEHKPSVKKTGRPGWSVTRRFLILPVGSGRENPDRFHF